MHRERAADGGAEVVAEVAGEGAGSSVRWRKTDETREEVYRIVLSLDHTEAIEVGAVGGSKEPLAVLDEAGEVEMDPALGEALHVIVDAPRPGDPRLRSRDP
jgi:hypothetical protein